MIYQNGLKIYVLSSDSIQGKFESIILGDNNTYDECNYNKVINYESNRILLEVTYTDDCNTSMETWEIATIVTGTGLFIISLIIIIIWIFYRKFQNDKQISIIRDKISPRL